MRISAHRRRSPRRVPRCIRLRLVSIGGLYRRAYSQLKLRYMSGKRTSEQTVDEILPAESTWVSVSFCLCANRPNVCTCHQRRHPLAVGGLDADLVTDMHEHVLVTHADQRQFAEVRVCREVFESVQLSSFICQPAASSQ